MARQTNRTVFNWTVTQAERQMDALFTRLAQDIGRILLNTAGPDGTVPVERLADVQAQVRALVDRVFLGPGGQGFDDRNEPQAPFPRIVADGQRAMIDAGLAWHAEILDRYLPEDVAQRLAQRSRLLQ